MVVGYDIAGYCSALMLTSMAGQFAGRQIYTVIDDIFSMMGEISFMWLLFHFCSFHFPAFVYYH